MTGFWRVTTEKAEIKLLKSRLLKIVMLPSSSIDLKSAIAITNAANDIAGNKLHANLIDIRKMMFMTSDARKHFKNFNRTNIVATAILIDSKLHKTLMQMYFKFTPPKIHTKVFDDEKEARAWLLEEINRVKEKVNSDVLF